MTAVPMYIGRRNVEGGGRQATFANQTFRMVAGVRGAINDGWGYDVSAQYSSGYGQHLDAQLLPDRPRRQVRSTSIDVGGVPTCRSALSGGRTRTAYPGTRSSPGGMTQDQLDYLQVRACRSARINQEIYNGVITGDLGAYGIKSPMASRRDPAGVRRRVPA